MYLRKSVFTLLLILCNVFVVVAQTTADSLALVTAHWNVTSMGKGVLCREAEFVSLYGVPQHVAILEIKPEQHRFDILIHSPKEETSSAARRSGQKHRTAGQRGVAPTSSHTNYTSPE